MPIATQNIPELTEKSKALFWSKVNKGGPTQPHMKSQCWIWEGGIGSAGYGVFGIKRKTFKSHRVSYFLENGNMQSGSFACHKCDNPICVRAEHIFEGSPKNNTQDAAIKGRMKRGDMHHLAKLTAEKVRDMRRKYEAGGITRAEIGRMFGVGRQTACCIIRRKTWAHVI
jgi:hypothetical protein